MAELTDAIKSLESANLAENQPEELEPHAEYMRDAVIPAMVAVRQAADKLEKVVADDLWPLPKYSEILFIEAEALFRTTGAAAAQPYFVYGC